MQHWAHPIHLLLGFATWSLWFVAMYGGLSVACGIAPPEPAQGSRTWLNLLLLLLTLATTVILLWAAAHCWRAARLHDASPAQAQFVRRLAAGLYLAAALATLAVGLPVAVLSPCT